jgi:hypothetical protein
MPYGTSDELWGKLPPDDQTAVIAGATGQAPPAIGGYAPVDALPAPPPNVVYGVPSDLWRRLPPDDQAAVRAGAMGVPPPAIGGYAPAPATPAPPPNLAAPGTSRTGPSGEYPAAKPVTTSTAAATNPGRLAGWTLASREARVGRVHTGTATSRGGRRLAGTPGSFPEDPLGAGLEDLDRIKAAIDDIHFREAANNADEQWRRWVETHWVGAPFTIGQLRAALSIVTTKPWYPLGKLAARAFARANPPGTPNPFEKMYLRGDYAAVLIRRARTINDRLARTTDGAHVRTLEGALSATGLALALVDPLVLYTIRYAGEYIGVGNPAEALKSAFEGG